MDGIVAGDFPAGAGDFAAVGAAGQPHTERERLSLLAQLGQLHRQGVLTDPEFAAQKAQILGE